MTEDTSTTSPTAITFSTLCVAIYSCSTMIDLVYTRDITAMFSYKTAVNSGLVNGLPKYIDDYTTRIADVRTTLSIKRSYVYAKTTFFIPTKYVISGFYDYQPESLISSTYYHPPFKIVIPDTTYATISSVGTMVATINPTYTYDTGPTSLCDSKIWD